MSFVRYPNALDGLRSLRSAAILEIWVLALTAAMSLVALFVRSDAALPVFFILAVAMLVLAIIGLIKELIGVSRAAKDFSIFASARTAIIFSMVFSVAAAVLERVFLLHVILELAASAFALYAAVLIFKGIIAIAQYVKNGNMVERTQKLLRFVLISGILAIILETVAQFLPEDFSNYALAAVIIVLALALGVVKCVLILRCYSDAVDMLDNDPSGSDGNPELRDSSADAPWSVYP